LVMALAPERATTVLVTMPIFLIIARDSEDLLNV
jgi:hypothetical protein